MASLRLQWLLLSFCVACTSFSDVEPSTSQGNAGQGGAGSGAAGQGGTGDAGRGGDAGKPPCVGEVCPAGAAGASGAGNAGAGAGGAGASGAGNGGAAGASAGAAGTPAAGAAGATGGSGGGSACQEGTRSCQVGVVQECKGGQWVLIENCLAQPQTTCEGGQCVPLPSCGNGACDAAESACTCPGDCGQPGCGECGNPACVVCGDAKCDASESCNGCPEDCGQCCGNGSCDAQFGESKCGCAADCGAPGCGECGNPACDTCGNGKCDGDESCASCPGDCGSCCGDGSCDAQFGESKCSCAADCGQPGCGECGNPACVVCGDAKCDASESCSSCPVDCGQCCGNGSCDNGETCGSCAGDCGSCGAVCGNGVVEAGEQCEGPSASCTDFGPYQPGVTQCIGCQASLAGCVPDTCGNGVVDAGEECDGATPPICGAVYPGAQGPLSCLPTCKYNLSACEYCGDDKLAPFEPCDGSLLPSSCGQLNAGGGLLSCKQCQLDTSQCASPSCGYKGGLFPFARWSLQDGCQRRPRRAAQPGPTKPKTTSPLGPTPPDLTVEPLVDEAGRLLAPINGGLLRFNNGTFENSNGSPGLTGQPYSAAYLQDLTTVVLYTQRIARFDLQLGATGSASVDAPSGGLLITGAPDPEGIYYPSGNRILKHQPDLGSQVVHYDAGVPLGGTMAYDDVNKRIIVAGAGCASGVGCPVIAVSLNGTKAWQTSMTGGALNAVTLAADGSLYLTGGSAIGRFNPKSPGAQSNTSVGGTRPLRPAVSPDGTIVVAFARNGSGSSQVQRMSSVLSKIWSKSITADLLSPPLLDSDDNTFICTSTGVWALDRDGVELWKISLPAPSISACHLLLTDTGRLDVITDSGSFRISD